MIDMSWRPPYNENYGQPRGFVPPGYSFARGYGGRPEMTPIGMPHHGVGRGQFPLSTPQGVAQYGYRPNSPQPKTDFSQRLHYQSVDKSAPTADMERNKDIEFLQSVWQDNRYPDKKTKLEYLYKKLSSILMSQPNPWEMALTLITSAPDYEQAKTVTLSFQILLQFQRWVQSSDNGFAGNEEKFLSQEFRIRVFYATTGSYISYFNAAVEAFLLSHPGNEYFLPYAKSLLLRDKLPEAAQIVAKLCLQSHFSRDEILVPLLLTDRVNLIEMYIKGDSQQQMLILNLLDYLCARNTDIISFAQHTGLKNIKGEKLSKKSLSKFAVRLMKMFDIPPEICPNISDNRAMSTVRFLLYKRYIEKSMTAECWDDMVESVIGSNTSLQQQFIMELMSYNDLHEAVRWADRYKLPDNVLDTSVVEAKAKRKSDFRPDQQQTSSMCDNVDEKKKKEEEDWDEELSSSTQTPCASSAFYYSIPLKDEDIVLVDSRHKLMAALERLTLPSTVIGIDCEWKPIGPSKQVALLQLAVEDRVFLVDFIQLDGVVSSHDWGHFARAMFCDRNILKIGYGLDTDLRMLSSSYPSMKESLLKMVRVVELSKLSRKVDDLMLSKDLVNPDVDETTETVDEESHVIDQDPQTSHRDATDCFTNILREPGYNEKESADFSNSGEVSTRALFGITNKNEEKGLSLLVKKILGKPLCKDEQMSNWEKRPLRRSQILYAAMDAYVLLDVHKHLMSQGLALGMSGQELEPAVIFRTKTRMDKKKHKINDNKKTTAVPIPSFVHTMTRCRPRELRVVCDSMLQGLGSQLRACGVDAYILGTGQQHEDTVQIALQEKRIILTSGMPYEQVRSQVGSSMCYCVPHTMKSKDQCIDVLRHFKVDVNVEDIFSRCAVCNRADFAHVTSVDMEKLYILALQRNQQRMAYPHCHVTDTDVDTKNMFSSKYGLDTASVTFLHNGVRVQIETIPSLDAFQSIDVFFVCVNCGKVYWKGSHFDRIQEQFKPVLSLGQANPSDVVDLGNENGYDDDAYDPVLDDIGKVNLQEAGFSGVWKIG